MEVIWFILIKLLLQVSLRFCFLRCVSHQLLIFPLQEDKIRGLRIAEPWLKLLAVGINMPVDGISESPSWPPSPRFASGNNNRAGRDFLLKSSAVHPGCRESMCKSKVMLKDVP